MQRPFHLARRSLVVLLLTAALSLHSALASAQIISTFLPEDRSQTAAAHVMLGYAAWEYGTDFYDRIVVESHGGTFGGSARSGTLIAGDFPFRLGAHLTVSVGGWLNHAGKSVANDPAHFYRELPGAPVIAIPDRVLTEQSQFSSVYGGLFYRWFGVQAGIVPVRIRQTLDVAGAGVTTSNRTQMDVDVFGVGRYTETTLIVPITVTVGLGAYRYSARAASLLVNGLFDEGTASPATTVFSGFVNFSVAMTSRIAVDFSAWQIAAKDQRLNDSQGRVTVGLGLKF